MTLFLFHISIFPGAQHSRGRARGMNPSLLTSRGRGGVNRGLSQKVSAVTVHPSSSQNPSCVVQETITAASFDNGPQGQLARQNSRGNPSNVTNSSTNHGLVQQNEVNIK